MATATYFNSGFHCRHATNSSLSSESMQRRSIIGSIKDKLSRSSSKSQTPNMSRGRTPSNNSRFSVPASSAKNSPSGNDVPPPPYSAQPSQTSQIPQAPQAPRRDVSPAPSMGSISAQSLSSPEDPFAFLTTFDTVVLIDDSGSMIGSRWREVEVVLRNIAPICTAHDDDGVDIYFLNHRSTNAGDAASGRAATGYNIKDAEQVERLFRCVYPCAMTPTGRRLQDILNPYLRHYENRVRACGGDAWATDVKPVNLIVITDGQPSDDPESVLLAAARRLDKVDAPPYQLGVQFFQVGDDRQATRALQDLDDELAAQAGVRDIVDTVTWNARDGQHLALTADAILKVVLGAVVKRLDRQNVAAEEPSGSSRFLSARRR